ncbi:MAG TPA: PilW family protein [Gammaproteobacteria bacterium]|jgi:type IV pilus assembly protein PilW
MRRHPINTQSGFSMVELMVALLIGVVLTSGVISVFITSKNTYNLNNAVGQVQEEGRSALTTLQPLIAMAGFSGCAHVRGDSIHDYKNLLGTGDSDPVYMDQYGIYGYEYKGTGIGASYTDTTGQTPAVATSASEWSPALSNELFTAISTAAAPVVKYSDILIIHEGQANPATVLVDSSATSPATTVGPLTYVTANAPAMTPGSIAIASDCTNGTSSEVTAFQITSMTSGSLNHVMNSGTPGNVSTDTNFDPYMLGINQNWPNHISSTGEVTPELTFVFYIGKSSVDQGTSLFELQMGPATGGTFSLAPQELVPGVENMQLLYGVDNSKGLGTPPVQPRIPGIFETADAITIDTNNFGGLIGGGGTPDGIWNDVLSVRVALIVHSDNNSIESNTNVVTTSGTKQALTNTVSQTFYMLGTSSTDSLTYNTFADRRLRRLFEETFSVRSQLP